MNDSPGVPSALGIEAVEWFAESGENLTVRITGRWRRRRPAWSGQATLVIETPGRRYRFPAMPEPPSLTGTGPGMWRISFAVPAALAPDLAGRTWLQFGAVVVPLPAAVALLGTGVPEPEAQPAAPPPLPPAATPDRPATAAGGGGRGGEHPQPSRELETESARRRIAEAESAVHGAQTALAELMARVDTLERELAAAHDEAERLAVSLAGQQRTRRGAEQRAHAERELRLDLARRLEQRSREAGRARQALGDLAAAEGRVRELELELTTLRRRIDEAEQAEASATVARERAELRAALAGKELERRAAASGRADGPAERERLSLEQGLVARRASAVRRVPSERQALPGPPSALPGLPSASITASAQTGAVSAQPGAEALVTALRTELDVRAGAEAGLRARLLEAEAGLAARVQLQQRLGATLTQLRDELDGLRGAFAHEREAREAAEGRAGALERELEGQRERAREAYQAIGELRATFEQLRSARAQEQPQPQPQPGPDPGRVEPERLTEALARLREGIAPQGDQPPPPSETSTALSAPGRADAGPWLEPAFRALARADPDRAGRLLVDLLPAQHAAFPRPVAYDLVLGAERGCVRVTVADDAPVIAFAEVPRASGDVDFQVFGDHAALARLMTAGPLRRRFGRRVARLRGEREGLAALEALLGLRLSLAALHRLGVRMQPRTAMTLVARLIEPQWTAGELFSLAYEAPGCEPVYLLVRDGRPVEVTEMAPPGRIATTVSGPAGSLELAISGERSEPATLSGDEWPLTLLHKWIKRAQSG